MNEDINDKDYQRTEEVQSIKCGRSPEAHCGSARRLRYLSRMVHAQGDAERAVPIPDSTSMGHWYGTFLSGCMAAAQPAAWLMAMSVEF